MVDVLDGEIYLEKALLDRNGTIANWDELHDNFDINTKYLFKLL